MMREKKNRRLVCSLLLVDYNTDSNKIGKRIKKINLIEPDSIASSRFFYYSLRLFFLCV
jgi:wyosine [tRNA(Phe)-imidazoG37] synthetase (radical SAM superfamily)